MSLNFANPGVLWGAGSAIYLLVGCHQAANSYESERCTCGKHQVVSLTFPRATALVLLLGWPLWTGISVVEWVWFTVTTAARAVTEPR